MPIYNYKCNNCENITQVNHSMSEKLTDCEICCTINSLNRLPNMIAVQYHEQQKGKVVRDYIQQAKEEIQAEKDILKSKEWNE